MTIKRLAVELVLGGGAAVAAGARRAGQALSDLGKVGKTAGEALTAGFEDLSAIFENLNVAGELRSKLVDPGIRAAADLQEALAELKLDLNTSNAKEELEALGRAQREAERVAGPTKFSAKDVVGIQGSLLKSGVGLNDVLGQGGAAEAVANLATAEKSMGADQASDAVVTMKAVFGLAGNQMTSAADALVRASSASTSSASDLAEALSQAPSAGRHLAPEEALAALGTIGNAGIKGGAGGTVLKNFLEKGAIADKKYGIDIFDKEGNFKGMVEAAGELRKAMGNKSKQEQEIALNKAFGSEGAPLALALLNQGAGSIEEVLAGMGQARGLADRTAIMAGTTSGQMEALGGTVETALATAFEPALDPLAKASGKLNELLTTLTTKMKNSPDLAKALSGGAIGAIGLGGLLSATGMGRRALNSSQMAKFAGFGSEAAGIAKGKAVEAATGIQPVYVTNWPESMGGPGAGGAGGAGAGGAGGPAGGGLAAKALGVVSAGAVGLQIGTAINESLIKGTKLADIYQGYLGTLALATPARFAMSDETLDSARLAQKQALSSLGVNVEVKIDKSGNAAATVTTDEGQVARSAGRSGVQ